MKTNRMMNTMIAVAVIVSMSMTTAGAADMPTDPIGGKPPAGAKASVKDLDYQVKYQRAFEAVVWSIPAVGIYGFFKAADKLGGEMNTICSWSKPAEANSEILTANNQTPYITSQTDLRKGPVVVELPAASDKASLYGQIVNHWQITIADVGPSGVDKGKGGKILLTPPGYSKKIPAGYIEVKSPSYRVAFAFRSIPGPNSNAAKAYEYSKTLKMYYLSEAPNPKPTKFIDPYTAPRFETLPVYDETYFEDVHAIFSVENAAPGDKVMMGMLASLGIEKGKPYNPDAKTKKAMRQAVIDAYYYMQHRYDTVTSNIRWWKDRQWWDVLFHDAKNEFTWETEDLINIDKRSDRFFIGTFYPKKVGPKPATYYLISPRDKDGNQLKAGKTYSLTIPKDMPVKQFWSLIVYDRDTWAFIYNPEKRAGLGSFDLPEMKKNTDGSVTLYFGPKAPSGLESNWIPTSGKSPVPTLRFYGATDAFFNRTFKMPDVELVK